MKTLIASHPLPSAPGGNQKTNNSFSAINVDGRSGAAHVVLDPVLGDITHHTPFFFLSQAPENPPIQLTAYPSQG